MDSPAPSARPRRRMRIAVVSVAAVGGVAALLAGLVWGGQRSLVYLPSGGTPPPADRVVEGAQDLTLHTDDGLELGGWYVPADSEQDRDAAVLVTNGNAGNRESRAPLAQALAQQGFSVLVFDYRGFGGNDGDPTEAGLTSDARAGLEALRERGHDPDRTLYWGESLGAGVAVNLAVEEPPAGLFLRSPFNSLADMAGSHYPAVPESMLRDTYAVQSTVADLRIPVTVAIGTADTVVPPEQSRAVAEAAPELVEEFTLDGAGHNDPAMVHGPEVVGAFVELAEEVL